LRDRRFRNRLLAVAVAAAALLGSDVGFAGFEVWTTGGPDGGEVRALVIAPTTPETIYAGTPVGVFRRTADDASWVGGQHRIEQRRRRSARRRSVGAFHALRRHARRRVQEHRQRDDLELRQHGVTGRRRQGPWLPIQLTRTRSTPGRRPAACSSPLTAAARGSRPTSG
jgi:hypothetical protein